MKKILSILILVTVSTLPLTAAAAVLTVDQLINRLKPVIWAIFGLIALICFVYAGIKFLTAGGDPDKIGDARKAFMYGVVGVVVGIIAYGIVAIMTNILT